MPRPVPPRDGQLAAARAGSRTGSGPAALAVLGVAVFGLVLVLVTTHWPPLVRLDDGVRDGLHRQAVGAPLLVDVLRAVSAVGTSGAYLVGLCALTAVLVRRGRSRAAGWAAATVVGGALLNTGVKALVGRARPVLPDPVATAAYSSFPSGHAQGVVVATGVLLLVLRPGPPRRARAVAVAVVWSLLMGFSRLGLGVHYLSDVVGGYLLGLAWLAACVAAAGGPAGLRTR